MGMNLFARITKVDEAKREVWGRAVEEIPDLSDEIFDYATSKPYFEAWSKKFADATDGKSLGNIRAMHGNTAAGKAIALDFNDADKAIDLGAKVVDDNEWAKVLEGVYTGFSIGGKYVGEKKTEKIADKDVRRYTADPIEISLVDSPCIPTCKYFDIVKADGSTLQKLFKAAEVVADPPKADETPKAAAEEVIEVTGTDEQVAEFGKALNAAGLTLADAIALINAEIARKNAPPPEPVIEPEPPTPDPVLELITSMAKTGELVARVNDPELSVLGLAKIAEVELTEEERAPLKSLDEVRAAIIAKAGARHSKSDKQLLQTAHDHLVALGADCDGDMDGKGVKPELTKAEPAPELAKLLEDALKRIETLEAQPMPRPGMVQLRTVEKTKDTVPGADDAGGVIFEAQDLILDAGGEVNKAASAIKFAQKLGGRPAYPTR